MAAEIMPSENWPPYGWLWERIGGRPWTHIMRDNPKAYLAVLLPVILVIVAWNARRFWPIFVSFVLGFLTGHVWW